MNQLTGKIAAITGGAKGIGIKIAERFLSEGCEGVAILDYDLAAVRAAAARLNSARVLAVRCDVASSSLVEQAFRAVDSRFGRVDILVNNAGLTRDAMLHKMTEEQWDTVLSANLKGMFLCMKQVVPGMRERAYGKIVNVSSVSAYGNVGQTNYAAAKAGVLGLTTTAALELGRKNITVNTVLPGYVETDMLKTVPERVKQAWIDKIPLQRLGRAEEVASAVLFFSGEESSFVTGSCLLCCGGGITAY